MWDIILAWVVGTFTGKRTVPKGQIEYNKTVERSNCDSYSSPYTKGWLEKKDKGDNAGVH